MKMTKTTMRRLLTASVSTALIISLTSCSAASDNTGKLNTDEVYAKAGNNISVTNGEIWNELKWNASEVLEDQITNVVLNTYINRINIVLGKNGEAGKTSSQLTEDDKKTLGFDDSNPFTEDAYNKLKSKYEKRIVDYVVQDIYNFTYSTDDYWDNFKDLEKNDIDKYELQYVDEIYESNQVSSVGGTDLKTLIKNASYENYEDKKDDYLKIAKGLSQIYYVLYAKELLAYKGLEADILEAEEDDEDDDDDTWGYYTTSQYVSKFKEEYTNNYNLNAVILNFSNQTELEETLRAFGLKLYNKQLYLILDSLDTEKYPYVSDTVPMTYEDYIAYYDDFENSKLGNTYSGKNQICMKVDSNAILEIYVQIYNYIYGGYKKALVSPSGISISFNDLNSLRKNTLTILESYADDDMGVTKLTNLITSLKTNNLDVVSYTADSLLDKYGSTFKNYMYDTLKPAIKKTYAEDYQSSTQELENTTTCFSTAGQSTSLGTTLSYKFEDYLGEIGTKTETDKTLIYFADWYNSDRTTYEILDLIQDTTKYPTLQSDIKELLKQDGITSTAISDYLSDATEDAKIQIYNEATEITYSKNHDNYSNAVFKNGDSNVLATIEYEGTTWNLNIVKNDEDENSIVIPGTDTKFGTYDYLERINGTTTAVNIISKKLIMDTKEYEKTNEDRTMYENYISNMLLAFANGSYASSGYSADLGKYKFLMLYFHTADIDEIIDNYYRVQSASAKVLNNYTDTNLLSFFEKYTDVFEDRYFSLGGSRILVYIDTDDDLKADEDFDWKNTIVTDSTSPFYNKSFEYVAQQLVFEIYNKISASTSSHTDAATSLVSEINSSAKAAYDSNPISTDNNWAKYRHLGLNVQSVDFSVTNASVDCDFALKQRLYDYSRGHNEANTKTYQYYINQTAPTCYIEPMTSTDYTDAVLKTKDGYNLVLVTSGTSISSAKWTKEDHNEGLLENIVLILNEDKDPLKIENIYNDSDKLNLNQIKLYIWDYALNGSSTLIPASISEAFKTYVEPVMTRYTGTETQKMVMLNYIAKRTEQSTTNLCDVIQFTNQSYNSTTGVFNNLLNVDRRVADSYVDEIYSSQDTTGTSSKFTFKDGTTWWDNITKLLKGEAI